MVPCKHATGYVFLIDMHGIVLRSICGIVLPFFTGHHGFKVSHVILDTLSLPLLMTPRWCNVCICLDLPIYSCLGDS